MIKFRSWISSTREFTYFEDGNYTRLSATKSHVFNWQTAEQFTGLKDKNKKEIFVGDILKPEGVVTYNEKSCKFYCVFPDSLDRDFKGFTKLEVIGNIHENSEYWGGIK